MWVGPDGTEIPLVPRYACEELLNVWETESVNGEKDFAQKAISKGILHPTGMYYQDLGWRANPRMSNKPGHEGTFFPDYIEYTTWKEYFECIADKPKETWKVTQEVFQGALPWGERILVRMARQVRRGEIGMLNGERLYALSGLLGGKPGAGERLEEAWGHLLMTQHHDGWICAGSGKGERNWAWKTSAQIYAAESLLGPVNRQAMFDVGKYACPIVECDGDIEMLSVVNPLSRPENRTVDTEITNIRGVNSFKVYDGEKLLESQYIANRTYGDGSKNAGHLIFNADLTGFGVKTFKIEPAANGDAGGSAKARIEGNNVYLENGFYRISFNLKAGGSIASLFDKCRGIEVTDNNGKYKFNEYNGYFINEKAYLSSTDNPAEASIVSNGPVQAGLLIKGSIGDVRFSQTVSVTEGYAKIMVHIVFHFPEKTFIGEPHDIAPENSRTEGHRSYHDGRYKLNAYFPTSFTQEHIYKDAAYDVCKSGLEDTHFQRWNEIKHNILIGWVDAAGGGQGLAVMADHTTSYTFGDGYPLGLTMAWGWDGGFWWGRRQLKGDHELVYAITPHDGDWRAGDIWHEHQKMLHPPITQRVAGRSVTAPRDYEFISAQAPVEMSASYTDPEGRVIVRLFNPGGPVKARVEIDAKAAGLVEHVELDGSLICLPDVERSGGKAVIFLDIPEFGIRTLRVTP